MTGGDGLTLPQPVREALRAVPIPQRHSGLQLDKFSAPGDQQTQRKAIEEVCGTKGDNGLLDSVLKRRERWLDQLRSRSVRARTTGPLTLHLARASALENTGIHLHPLYGFCCLPGSGIKGMTRAWAETVWRQEHQDAETPTKGRIREVFGAVSEATGAGAVVFHDAWPTAWPRLEPDIANNHHVKYYDGKDDPGDWDEPNPVTFLTVRTGTEFHCALSLRHPDGDKALLELAAKWLTAALVHAGSGAKTNAGYGRFEVLEEPAPSAPRTARRVARHKLTLATPAFLAGARQNEDDCDLRPATLRGLLRWWWRTLHAGHLGSDQLRKLEAAIWGSAKVGSALSLSLQAASNVKPEPFDRNAIKRDHGLSAPPRHAKTIQGLFYNSYGMDERNRRRWYTPAKASWRLVLSARDQSAGPQNRLNLSAGQVLRQAQAALWLLGGYGCAGSRARKGFGSFQDLQIDWIDGLDSCIREAASLRTDLGLHSADQAMSPRIEDLKDEALTREWTSVWDDPWCAMDRIGAIYQDIVKSFPATERLPLGLPRRGARPSRDRGQVKRHASPLQWSLSRNENSTLTVRLSAFPSARLPNRQRSREALARAVRKADELMEARRSKPCHGGSAPGRQGRGAPGVAGGHSRRRRGGPARHGPPTGPRISSSQQPPGLPNPGDKLEAVLLEEKTKKGGWKARHEGSGLTGPIQNSDAIPPDAAPGQRVELILANRQPQFRWPGPQDEIPPRTKKSGRSRPDQRRPRPR